MINSTTLTATAVPLWETLVQALPTAIMFTATLVILRRMRRANFWVLAALAFTVIVSLGWGMLLGSNLPKSGLLIYIAVRNAMVATQFVVLIALAFAGVRRIEPSVVEAF